MEEHAPIQDHCLLFALFGEPSLGMPLLKSARFSHVFLIAIDAGWFRNLSRVAPAPGGVLKLSSASIRARENFHTSQVSHHLYGEIITPCICLESAFT